MFKGFVLAFDWLALSTISIVLVSAYQIKKIKLPAWCPPVPVICWLISFVLSFLLGFITNEIESLGDAANVVLLYGLANGTAVALFSTFIYSVSDTVKKWGTYLLSLIFKGGKKDVE